MAKIAIKAETKDNPLAKENLGRNVSGALPRGNQKVRDGVGVA